MARLTKGEVNMNNAKTNLYSIEQAAEQLNVSPFTLRAWVHQGRIPYVKLGSRVLFRQKDLESFIEQHLVSPISEHTEVVQ
jgi:excisionase family DNA binding protein